MIDENKEIYLLLHHQIGLTIIIALIFGISVSAIAAGSSSTDTKSNYELLYDIENQEIRVKQESVIVKINKDSFIIDDWELKFYEANLGKITHISLHEMKCKNK